MNEEIRTQQDKPWVLGIVLIVAGVAAALAQVLGWQDVDVLPIVIMGGIGLTFLAVYWTDRSRWWALIPAYVFLAIGSLILLDDSFGLDAGYLAPLLIAAPFVYVYLNDRSNWWALIPAYVMGAVTAFIWADDVLGWSMEFLIPLAIALPFFIVFAVDTKENWWALIPGGILGAVGIGLALEGALIIIPVIMIGLGAYLLVRRRDEPEQAPQRDPLGEPGGEPVPVFGPEADRPHE